MSDTDPKARSQPGVFEDRRMPPMVARSESWDLRSEKQWTPDPVVLISHCHDLVFSQGDGGSLWGVLRKRIGHQKATPATELRKNGDGRNASGSEKEADQRELIETKKSNSVFLLETLFLNNVRYSCCRGSNDHSWPDALKSNFSSPNLSLESQSHISKDLLVISSFIVLRMPQASLII